MSTPTPPSTAKARIAEQVVANVLSGAILLAVVAFGSWMGLQLQRYFQFIVIPTNLLIAIGFISLGACLALLLVAALLYAGLVRVMSKSPVAVLLLYLGLFLALAIHDPKMRDRVLDHLNETPQPKP